jgi:hypothetical protein
MISTLEAVAGGCRPPAWWRVAPGVTWIQCHDPVTVDRVRKLKGARLVARGVNIYLRTYEVPHPVGWVEALMTKAPNPPSNEAFFSANAAGDGREPGKVSG